MDGWMLAIYLCLDGWMDVSELDTSDRSIDRLRDQTTTEQIKLPDHFKSPINFPDQMITNTTTPPPNYQTKQTTVKHTVKNNLLKKDYIPSH